MKILSLDLSTKKVGWAIFVDGDLIHYGLIYEKDSDIQIRKRNIKNEIKNIIFKYDVSRVVIEGLSNGDKGDFSGGSSNFGVSVKLAVMRGYIECVCDDYNIECVIYDPVQWRKMVPLKEGYFECKTCHHKMLYDGDDTPPVSCPMCGEQRKTYIVKKSLYKKNREYLKKRAIEVVNNIYNLDFKYFSKDTKGNISDDDIAEAILIGLADINNLK